MVVFAKSTKFCRCMSKLSYAYVWKFERNMYISLKLPYIRQFCKNSHLSSNLPYVYVSYRQFLLNHPYINIYIYIHMFIYVYIQCIYVYVFLTSSHFQKVQPTYTQSTKLHNIICAGTQHAMPFVSIHNLFLDFIHSC